MAPMFPDQPRFWRVLALFGILEFEDAVQISPHYAPAIELAQHRCNFLF
jgi:hypothetical protein